MDTNDKPRQVFQTRNYNISILKIDFGSEYDFCRSDDLSDIYVDTPLSEQISIIFLLPVLCVYFYFSTLQLRKFALVSYREIRQILIVIVCLNLNLIFKVKCG